MIVIFLIMMKIATKIIINDEAHYIIYNNGNNEDFKDYLDKIEDIVYYKINLIFFLVKKDMNAKVQKEEKGHKITKRKK